MERDASFAKEFGQPLFNFALGSFLIVAVTDVPSWAGWLLTGFVAVFGLVAILQFGSLAHFWGIALKNRERFSPGGDLHDHSVNIFDHTVNVCYDYRNKETYWFSVAASLVFMAGLIQHELWIAFTVEAIASVVGYSVIRAFLTHFHIYYALVKGKELENA